MKKEKLKTLKDFESNKDFTGDNILRDELRAEAVKWEKKEKSEDVKLWIIDFFNLTDENLK